jgi:tetratricopeptide (TPR) repeat protein
MVSSDDRRWTPLIAAWVKRSVALTTEGQTAGFSREELEAAIQCLLLRRHESTCLTLQNSISKVVLTEFQDSLLRQLVQTRNPDDAAAVRPVVTARLHNGTVSREVLEAAAAIRAAEWGPLLLEGFWRSEDNRRAGNQIPIGVVLACASQQQIEELIGAWGKLEADNQTELLGWLARYNHPEWRRLAGSIMEQLSRAGRTSSVFNHYRVAVQLLAEDASDESLQLLLTSARNWVASLKEDRGSSVESQNVIQQLLSQLAVFSHPECRRFLNQLTRSDIAWLRAQADDYRQNARGRSPAWRLIAESYQKKKAGDEAAAAEALEMAVRADPFCPDALVRRASHRMHGGRFDDSMADLTRALELTPEHEEVLSLMALVQVRQGKVDEGLAAAEELIRQIPNDLYSLYNGACTYARAAERADTAADRRSMFIARAIELLKLNNAAGHDDHQHMSTDPDLNILHDHPAWQELLEQARQNALKQPNPNN